MFSQARSVPLVNNASTQILMSRLKACSLKLPIPVTCLRQVDCAGFQFLLIGTGGVLEAINLHDFSLLCDSSPLLTQAIRCIVPISFIQHGKNQFVQTILVQGGSQVAWVELWVEFESPAILIAHFKIIHKCRLKHWMICGQPSNSLGFAATFLSSYNVLYRVKVDALTKTLEWSRLNDKLTTFLYSGDFTEIDDYRYLVASGTAFGKVLIWLCLYDEQQAQWVSIPRQEFEGHQGSIFGVSISNLFHVNGETRRVMATCSDDRTIRVWDVSDATSDKQKHLKEVILPGQTESTSSLELTRTWAHASRIWNVDIMSATDIASDRSSIALISTGEDATAQSWALNLDNLWQSSAQKQPVWENVYIDNHHSGKNIWARCYVNDKKGVTFYTGGSDGQIVFRSYDNVGSADQSALRLSQMFRDISVLSKGHHTTPFSGRKPLVLKSYMVSNTNDLLATTGSGLFLRGTFQEGEFVWQLLLTGSQHRAFTLCRQLSAGVAFLSDPSSNSLLSCDTNTFQINSLCEVKNAKVAAIEISWSAEDALVGEPCVCLAVSYFGSSELDIVWLECAENALKFISRSSFHLPQAFEVTSTCYDPEFKILLVGSRAGAIAIYTAASSTTSKIDSTCCRRRVHGSDTVTSIQKLAEDGVDNGLVQFYLTTGRDGTYCVIQVVLASPPQVKVVHQTTPPLGPNIEGANIVHQSNGSKKLLLHGFQSTNFVVWDDTHQTQVMSVDCGGAHRNWAFARNDETNEDSTFVWTKASTLMYHRQAQTDHKIVRSGAHGREIKALAVAHLDRHRKLIATGSEDTDIRLFELKSDNTADRQLECHAVLRRHTTGLQDLKFSPAGDYLFSAAGMEELYAWKLTAVPVIKQGICFAGALQRHDVLSDARIMSIDTRNVLDGATGVSYVLVGAFSNGKLKVIEYAASPDDEHTGIFTILNQFDCGTICLTQAQFLTRPNSEQNRAVVAGTNGCVSVSHIGGTDHDRGQDESRSVLSLAHKIHQNSITALQAVKLSSSIQLLITGGDDNALAVSLCHNNTRSDETTRFKTLIIPKAHAAALTALVVLDLNSTLVSESESESESGSYMRRSFVVVTAGNDQRIKTWGLTIDPYRLEIALCDTKQQKDAMAYIEVEPMDNTHTNVADVSEIEVLQHFLGSDASEFGYVSENPQRTHCDSDERVLEVLIVGVGMEAMSLQIPSIST